MKNLIIAFLILITISASAQVKWMTIDEALAAQKSSPKKILIDFYADWCSPCKLLDKDTYANPVISSYINQNYYPVKFNIESNEKVNVFGRTYSNPNYVAGKKRNSTHQFVEYMNVTTVPSMVFLDEASHPITILNGYLTPREVEPYLSLISTDAYKKIKTKAEWDDYQSKFKTKLKN